MPKSKQIATDTVPRRLPRRPVDLEFCPGNPEVYSDQLLHEFSVSPEILQERYGSQDENFIKTVALQLMQLGVIASPIDAGGALFALAALRSAKPHDALEALGVTQMTASHDIAMKMALKLGKAETPQMIDACSRAMNSAMRTYVMQTETRHKLRLQPPNITVANVTVNDSGQAIVGNVSNAKTSDGQ